jgi:hypothetical protein
MFWFGLFVILLVWLIFVPFAIRITKAFYRGVIRTSARFVVKMATIWYEEVLDAINS